MKFRDGYWGLKKGTTLLNPIEIRDTEVKKNSLTLYFATREIIHRGATLNCPILTKEITSPLPDIIRIQTYHFKGGLNTNPEFILNSEDSDSVVVSESDHKISYKSGNLLLSLDKQNKNQLKDSNSKRNMECSYNSKYLTSLSGQHSGHITNEDLQTFMCEYVSLSVGESIYGMGERFTPFVKNGQVVDIWNEDGGTSSEQAYKNIPFFLSNRGYGILVNNPGKVSFEVASEVVTTVQFSVPGELLDYYIIGGSTMKDVLSNYTKLTGKPALPPAWSFGLWLTTSFTTPYNEETVNHFIDGMKERDIPLHVFHFDCFWMKEFQWLDFQWDREQFPDPKGMLSRLKKKGLNICVWINPYIAQKSLLFDEGIKHGYLLKKHDGSVWQWDRWQAGMGLVDFTNPNAVEWYKNELRQLIEMGVDTFKTDFGERIPTDVVYYNGADPVKMHNYYTYLYNKTVFELIEEIKGKNKALVFARSATVGGQKFPVHWGGDCSATYESMAESLRGGLSLALSGFGFWSHDISGFELTATPDLYKRWIAFGSLSSHSRLHGSESYRVPWNFDDESSDILRFFTKLKCSLMPYIFNEAVNTHSTGIPMMRAMVLQYPDDPGCAYLDRQYMFGDSLLVSPVFNKNNKVSYYLPHGKWTNFITGEQLSGGGWREEEHNYYSLPLMVPANSIIAVGAVNTLPEYDYAKNVTFHIFNLEDSCNANAVVYSTEVEKVIELCARRSDDSIEIIRKGTKSPWNIYLRGVSNISHSSCGSVSNESMGILISFNEEEESVIIKL